ncbi:MAG TPA: TolC family protein [Firmicutes bacterium]|nr:TolC family protein [Bacillota bacterium]
MREAIDLALAASPDVANAEDTLAIARSNFSLVARKKPVNPVVKVDAGVEARWDTGWNSYEDMKQISLSVEDSVPTGRYLNGPSSEEKLVALQVRDAERNLELTREDVIYKTMSAYIAVLKAQKSLTLAQKAFDLEQTLFLDTRTKLELGVASTSDLLKAQQALDEARAGVSKAQAALEVSYFQFNQLTGRPPETPVILVDQFKYSSSSYDLDQMIASALEKRAEIQKARDDLTKAKVNLDDVLQSQKPVVTVSGGYTGEDWSFGLSTKSPRWDLGWQAGGWYTEGKVEASEPRTGWHVGLDISWTPFDGGVGKEKEKEARITVAQMERQIREQESQVALSVRQAYNDLEAAQDAVLNTETSLRLAQENLKIIELRRQGGYATDRDVKQADLAVLQARLNNEFAIYDYILAEAKLRRAAGQSFGVEEG